MRKNTEISSEQFKEIINNFYNYFENGYVFEDFLKSYLEKIGLDEVYVTKRSDDGGIDLRRYVKVLANLIKPIRINIIYKLNGTNQQQTYLRRK